MVAGGGVAVPPSQPRSGQVHAERCLTPRSSGAPTAGHQARAGGTRYIFTSPGLASSRCRPLSSNVRPRRAASLVLHAQLRAATCPVFSLRRGTSRSACRGLAHRLGSRSGHEAVTRTNQRTCFLPEVSSSRPCRSAAVAPGQKVVPARTPPRTALRMARR